MEIELFFLKNFELMLGFAMNFPKSELIGLILEENFMNDALTFLSCYVEAVSSNYTFNADLLSSSFFSL